VACAPDELDLIAATRGGDDVVVLVAGEIHEARARKVPVADTVGAGDSFMAGLVSGLLDANLLGSADSRASLETAGWPQVAPAVHRAVACSAITVGRAGANPPTRRELS